MKKGLFSIAYLPSVEYLAAMLSCEEIWLEAHESFNKQSYRNRCYIDSPNGRLLLNYPVQHQGRKQIDQIAISERENWRQKHWQALQTSYGSSPFFEAVAEDLRLLYFDTTLSKLWDFNLAALQVIFKWLRVNKPLHFTEIWQANPENASDFREALHPKKPGLSTKLPSYPQVFDGKHGFQPNLSVVDLIFNEGPAAYDYLAGLKLKA